MLARKCLMLGDLLKKADYIAKITETEGKILSITGLVTTANVIHVTNFITTVT